MHSIEHLLVAVKASQSVRFLVNGKVRYIYLRQFEQKSTNTNNFFFPNLKTAIIKLQPNIVKTESFDIFAEYIQNDDFANEIFIKNSHPNSTSLNADKVKVKIDGEEKYYGLNNENIIDLLCLSNLFRIDTLQKSVFEWIKREVTGRDTINMYLKQYNFYFDKNKLENIIEEKLIEIIDDSIFLELPIDLILKMISRNKNVFSSSKIIKIIKQMINKMKENKKYNGQSYNDLFKCYEINKFLKFIEFEVLSKDELIEIKEILPKNSMKYIFLQLLIEHKDINEKLTKNNHKLEKKIIKYRKNVLGSFIEKQVDSLAVLSGYILVKKSKRYFGNDHDYKYYYDKAIEINNPFAIMKNIYEIEENVSINRIRASQTDLPNNTENDDIQNDSTQTSLFQTFKNQINSKQKNKPRTHTLNPKSQSPNDFQINQFQTSFNQNIQKISEENQSIQFKTNVSQSNNAKTDLFQKNQEKDLKLLSKIMRQKNIACNQQIITKYLLSATILNNRYESRIGKSETPNTFLFDRIIDIVSFSFLNRNLLFELGLHYNIKYTTRKQIKDKSKAIDLFNKSKSKEGKLLAFLMSSPKNTEKTFESDYFDTDTVQLVFQLTHKKEKFSKLILRSGHQYEIEYSFDNDENNKKKAIDLYIKSKTKVGEFLAFLLFPHKDKAKPFNENYFDDETISEVYRLTTEKANFIKLIMNLGKNYEVKFEQENDDKYKQRAINLFQKLKTKEGELRAYLLSNKVESEKQFEIGYFDVATLAKVYKYTTAKSKLLKLINNIYNFENEALFDETKKRAFLHIIEDILHKKFCPYHSIITDRIYEPVNGKIHEKIKICVVGGDGVGKSTLVQMMSGDESLDCSTKNTSFYRHSIFRKHEAVLWKVKCVQSNQNMTSFYVKSSDVIIFVASSSDKTSLEEVKKLYDLCRNVILKDTYFYCIFVVTKCDLPLEIKEEDIEETASILKSPVFYVSREGRKGISELIL